MLRGNLACRTCYEDATTKLIPWNLGFAGRRGLKSFIRLFSARVCPVAYSSHSTTPIPTPTSSPTSSRGLSGECRRVVQLAATVITSGNRACRTCRRGSSRGCWRVSVSVPASWNASFFYKQCHVQVNINPAYQADELQYCLRRVIYVDVVY